LNIAFTDALTAGSILVAIVVAHLGLRKQREESQVQHTIDLIVGSFEEGPVYRCKTELRSWIVAGRVISDDKLCPTDDEVVATVLNFYDFLASLVKIDDLDVRVLKGTLGGVICRDFDFLEDYIVSRRKSSVRPNLYMNLQEVVRGELDASH